MTAVFKRGGGLLAVLLLAFAAFAAAPDGAMAQQAGEVPGGSLGANSDAEMWRAVRGGIQGDVSIPDRKAGILVQSEGENWRAVRNGPVSVYGAWAVLGVTGLLALFFLLRGRIRIDAGPSRSTIERFNTIERFAHWLMAIPFIILALTGLNMLYGRYILLPAIGPDAFSWLTLMGKYAHHYLAFPFMVGVVLAFVLWVKHNIPNRVDLAWMAKGGGLLQKGVHPPSRKFNAGQKLIFWSVTLLGFSVALSGWALLFPFEYAPWSATFAKLNLIGFNLPTDIGVIQEQQLSQAWHAIVSLVFIAIIMAHIYIGSVGMEGAFAAMGDGRVDENWAREHHNLWVAEVKGEPEPDWRNDGGHHGKPAPAPAE